MVRAYYPCNHQHPTTAPPFSTTPSLRNPFRRSYLKAINTYIRNKCEFKTGSPSAVVSYSGVDRRGNHNSWRGLGFGQIFSLSNVRHHLHSFEFDPGPETSRHRWQNLILRVIKNCRPSNLLGLLDTELLQITM
jgi:hypothetical protein